MNRRRSPGQSGRSNLSDSIEGCSWESSRRMSSTKVDVTKFDGTCNIPLWYVRIKDLPGRRDS
jgi:hypothetical protein